MWNVEIVHMRTIKMTKWAAQRIGIIHGVSFDFHSNKEIPDLIPTGERIVGPMCCSIIQFWVVRYANTHRILCIHSYTYNNERCMSINN